MTWFRGSIDEISLKTMFLNLNKCNKLYLEVLESKRQGMTTTSSKVVS